MATNTLKPFMVVSPSAIETYDLCNRKWWFQKIARLPQPPMKARTFGTVLHDVAARWLDVDDLGRDKDGKPVEIYPPDWAQAEEQFGPNKGQVTYLDDEEKAMVKRFISTAIEEGVLERRTGRMIEEKVWMPLLTLDDIQALDCVPIDHYAGELVTMNDWGKPALPEVYLTGFVDYAYDMGIEDHKTVKKMAYALSKAKLRKNTQILIYQWWWIVRRIELGLPIPDAVVGRHNQFCKDPNNFKVRSTEVQIPVEDIEHHWGKTQDKVRQMVRYRCRVKKHTDIPDPVNIDKACRAYGGCPFLRICNGIETVERYKSRMQTRQQVNQGGTPKPKTTEDAVSIIAKLKAQAAANRADRGDSGAAAPAAAPPAEAPASSGETPPWYNPGCGACKDNKVLGFNSKGSPCRMCVLKADKSVRPDRYDITVADDGATITWKPKGVAAETESAGEAPTTVPEPKVEQTNDAADEAPPAPPAEAPKAPRRTAKLVQQEFDDYKVDAQGRIDELEDLVEQLKADSTRGVAAASAGEDGITILINASLVSPPPFAPVPAAIFFNKVIGEYEAETKANYYTQDTFKRRDALKSKAAGILNMLREEGRTLIYHGPCNGSDDVYIIVEALIPLANKVIKGHA